MLKQSVWSQKAIHIDIALKYSQDVSLSSLFFLELSYQNMAEKKAFVDLPCFTLQQTDSP